MRDICFRSVIFALALFAAGWAACPASAETVSYVSIGCDTVDATKMAETALLDQMSGKDYNAFDRITAYRKTAGKQACRPLNQGDQVQIIRERDDYVCVREIDEQLLKPGDPECYWILHRHIKLPSE